ncbi:MAG TPA: GDP-mannose 4,6-dehydratase, partial [Thermomicrobiales bacterium]|nr:GDP-mannose 4,6-dehydratase [Thermomicrobiales bacterium]
GLCRHPVSGRGYTPLVADLLDRELISRVVREVAPTHVFHLAAQSSVAASFEDAGGTLTNNLAAEANLLDACRALPAPPRVLVVGSAEEYGLVRPEETPLTEAQPFRPTSPYAVSKVAQDLLGWQYFHSYGLPVVRVRPFNHAGPGQSDQFAISAFARQIAEIEAGRREPVVRVGNLDARRDFLDVRDVARAHVLALTRGTPGAVYNIGSGVAVRVGDALDALLRLARVPVAVEPEPARLRPSDVPLLVADSRALREATGWRPAITLGATLAATLEWWRDRVASGEEGD